VAAILLALASAAVYGVADYCGGRATRTEQALAVVVVGQTCGALVVFAVVPFLGDPVAPFRDWLLGGAGGLSGVLGLLAFYTAMSRGPMTLVAPLTAVVSAGAPVVWGVISGDRPGPLGFAGLVLALCSIGLISGFGGSGSIGNEVHRSTVVFAVLGGLGFASTFILFSETGDDAGLWPLAAARVVSIAVGAAIIIATRKSFAIARPKLGLVSVGGALDMVANVFYLLASRRGLLSIVAVITSLYPASTVALAFGFDKERITRSQAVGMGIALAALVLVSVG
jgi:drug/metabolite transporter (DMT)-like permease